MNHPGDPKRVLVIEDNGVVADLIGLILKERGFAIHRAPDGESGLAACASIKPDLILCDFSLPGMDGHDVLRQLLGNPGIKSVPFIFVSARTDRAFVRESMALGADDVISKPFTPAEIIAAVHSRLERHRALNLA